MTTSLRVRVTPADKAWLEALAAAAGLKLSDYVRALLNGALWQPHARTLEEMKPVGRPRKHWKLKEGRAPGGTNPEGHGRD